ncbi:hypothetical protein LOD99_13025 [Oopsacas minuta]|uniref:BTB domain-containing protein n=1 Tax=Oopsacas minuta TaxID=111878 RepID=A0AAV7JAN1_9METZ|nr:hypothetical protein LOD99_13025 [Oopsacas minuta]
MSDKPTNSLSNDLTDPSDTADSTPSYLLAANAIHHLRLFHESMRELGKYSKLNIMLNDNPLVSDTTSTDDVLERESTFSMQISPSGITLSLPDANVLSLEPSPEQLASLRPILFNNPFLSDCLISIKDESMTYYCHRVYLSEESEYFSAMFRPSYSESGKKEVEISLEHPEMFEEALCYFYKGSISDKLVCTGRWRGSIDSYFQLIWVANYLQASKLLTSLTNLFEVKFSSSPLFNSEYMTFSLFQSVITSCRHRMGPRIHTIGSRVDPQCWLRSKYSSNRTGSRFEYAKRMRRIMSRSTSSSLSSMSRSPDWRLPFHSNDSPLRSRSRSVSTDPNRYIPTIASELDSSMLDSSEIFEDSSHSVYSNSSILQTTFSYAENSNRNNSRLGGGADECKEVLEWASAENITGELLDSDVVNVIKSFPGAVQRAVDPYGLLSKTKGKYN